MTELRHVDDFELQAVVGALRAVKITERCRKLLVAHASAPDRAMSRLELARACGGKGPQTCNSVYGAFARDLAKALDPSLEAEWRQSGYWVSFVNWGPKRWTRRPMDEPDWWVFVMRETLSRALEEIHLAGYTPLSDRAIDELVGRYPDGPSRAHLNTSSRRAIELISVETTGQVEASREETTETERASLELARVGQGRFRDQVVQRWQTRCAVTGAGCLPALVASHIVPWRSSSDTDRLNPANGLLLCGTLDRLFDAGLVSFDDRGGLLISAKVSPDDRQRLALRPEMKLSKVPPDSLPFLARHRREVFRA